MPPSHQPNQPDHAVEHSGTLLETGENIRQALLAGRKEAAPTASEREAAPFRPTTRPPVPLLTICDDGDSDGELVRIRGPRFVIGRTHGDLTIQLDKQMSSRHVEITHQVVSGAHRWVITDLQSRHGLFVRVSRALLTNETEILVGNGRYRFDAPPPASEQTGTGVPVESDSNQTLGLPDGPAAFRHPALTEILGTKMGNRVALVKPEYWIGTDPGCPICRCEDPFCEPRHARIYRKPTGDWYAEHNKSQNGLWLRMSQVTVETSAQFQIGEQRFRLKVK
jgi:hypothetical protein